MLALNLLFAIIASAVALFVIGDSPMGLFLYHHPPSFHYAVVSVALLIVWLLYGLILGYLRKKYFIKFISVFWGPIGLLGMMGYIFPSRIAENLVAFTLPAIFLIFAPTYGLGYYLPLNPELPFALYCLILVWSSGGIGYLLGTLINKQVFKDSNANKSSDK